MASETRKIERRALRKIRSTLAGDEKTRARDLLPFVAAARLDKTARHHEQRQGGGVVKPREKALALQTAIRAYFRKRLADTWGSRFAKCHCGLPATHDGSSKGNSNLCDDCMPDFDQHDYPDFPEANELRDLARLGAFVKAEESLYDT